MSYVACRINVTLAYHSYRPIGIVISPATTVPCYPPLHPYSHPHHNVTRQRIPRPPATPPQSCLVNIISGNCRLNVTLRYNCGDWFPENCQVLQNVMMMFVGVGCSDLRPTQPDNPGLLGTEPRLGLATDCLPLGWADSRCLLVILFAVIYCHVFTLNSVFNKTS